MGSRHWTRHLRIDRLRHQLGQLRRRLLALPAACGVQRRRRGMDDIRRCDCPRTPRHVRNAAGRLGSGPDGGDRQRDPIGALTTLLPTWFLIPFFLVALAGLVGGAVLDIYSSGLALLTLGLRTPRWVAAGIDGVIMVLGTIYFVWIADNFFFPFQGFLITLAVPIAAWAGIFIADVALRKKEFAAPYRPRASYK